MTTKIESFRDLNVYQAAFRLQQEIFTISKTFPKEERYSLTDQIRRSSRSIGANLAECWQKRRYVAHFVSKLTDADGEKSETEHWIDTAHACGYIQDAAHNQLAKNLTGIGRMLGSMISKPEKFLNTKD